MHNGTKKGYHIGCTFMCKEIKFSRLSFGYIGGGGMIAYIYNKFQTELHEFYNIGVLISP